MTLITEKSRLEEAAALAFTRGFSAAHITCDPFMLVVAFEVDKTSKNVAVYVGSVEVSREFQIDQRKDFENTMVMMTVAVQYLLQQYNNNYVLQSSIIEEHDVDKYHFLLTLKFSLTPTPQADTII